MGVPPAKLHENRRRAGFSTLLGWAFRPRNFMKTGGNAGDLVAGTASEASRTQPRPLFLDPVSWLASASS
ncbi:hypothetical protein SBA3_1490005 [Candidatus Sulfopaludibacter sp. SbA3]|nr:hypothetical protein SBA3_1490005 [Candidatus Sulfopaludibacter sp. SbA3]